MLGSRPQSHKTVHGTITKLFENFGYVNENIFFMRSTVSGGQPRVGDRVSVTAEHTPGQPSKWTAQSVRIESHHRSGGSGSQGGKRTGGGSGGLRPSGPQQAYAVSVPHRVLGLAELSVMELRQRYPRLHPPSDLFHVSNGWTAAFPAGSPLPLGCRDTAFHVFPRDVEPLVLPAAGDSVGSENPAASAGAAAVEDPTDQDYRYTAKVMLLSSPALAELYKQTCSMAQEPADSRDRCVSLSKTLRFLCCDIGGGGSVDSKSAGLGPFALGGPWSPSVDGEDPDGDPMVLVRTAVRHVKRLAGIDLTVCTTWYKFMELHYYREPRSSDKSLASGAEPAKEGRMETVVYYLPDVWNAVPDAQRWAQIGEAMAQRVDSLIYPPPPPPPEASAAGEGSEPADSAAPDTDATSATTGGDASLLPGDESKAGEGDQTAASEAAEAAPVAAAGRLTDLQAMKVADLRRELESRGKDSRGLKAQLVSRLEEVLRAEAAEAEKEKEAAPAAAAAAADAEMAEPQGAAKTNQVKEEEEEKEGEKMQEAEEPKPRVSPLTEREQEKVRRSHRLPDHPALLAWPSSTAKGGRLRLESSSLSQLLGHRQETSGKESAFEVALFCEQFHEMLTRDSAFALCAALAACDQERPSADPSGDAHLESPSDNGHDDGDSSKEGENEDEEEQQPKRKRQRRMPPDEAVAPTGLTRTVHPALLMACEFFDRERTGHLAARDIEELILGLGLMHSRSQIRRWIDRAATATASSDSKDDASSSTLRYRRLTDRPVTAASATAGYTTEDVSADAEPAAAAGVFDRAGGCPPTPADAGCVELLLLRSAEAAVASAAARERLCRGEAPFVADAEAEATEKRREAESEITDLKQRTEVLTEEEAEHRRAIAEYQSLLRNALASIDETRRPFVELFDAERREAEERQQLEQKRREAEAAARAEADAATKAAAAKAAAEKGDASAAAADEAEAEDDEELAGPPGGDDADLREEDNSKEWSVVDAV